MGMLESIEGGIGAEYGYGAVFSGYIEGLGRSLEGDADIARMVADRCKRSYPNGLLFY